MQAPTTRSAVAAYPNVTPMIDVMLVLLIIFMVVAPALISGVVVEPPAAANFKPRPEKDGEHSLAIDALGRYYLDKQPIESSALAEALAALYPPSTLDRVLYLRAHKELEYRHVLAALDVARKNGVIMVGMVTEQRPRQ